MTIIDLKETLQDELMSFLDDKLSFEDITEVCNIVVERFLTYEKDRED